MPDDLNQLGAIDSEIALTALFTITVAGYPLASLDIYPYVKLAAVGLLVLTLVRRVGSVNGLTDDDVVIRATTHLINPATYVSFLYLSYALTRWLAVTIGLGSDTGVAWFSAVTTALVFAVFLSSELLFGAALREGERVFSATSRQHRGEVFGAVLSLVATFVARSRHREGEPRQVKLARFYDRSIKDYPWDEQVEVAKSFWIILVSFCIPLLAYSLLVAVGGRVFGIGWSAAAVLLVPVILVSAFTRLWYSNYGFVQVEDRNGYGTFLGEGVAFLVVGWMVF